MKKLNENLLRKLIIETIEEQSGLVTEGKKKKKIKEAEPVPQPSVNPEADVATGMNNPDFDMSDAQAANMMPQFSDDQIKNAHDALDKAFEFAKSGNPMFKSSSEDILKQIMKMFKGEEQQ